MEQNFFKRRREELELTQFKLAIALGVTPSAVGTWERGESVPRIKDAAKLATVYQVSEKRIIDVIVEMSRAVA